MPTRPETLKRLVWSCQDGVISREEFMFGMMDRSGSSIFTVVVDSLDLRRTAITMVRFPERSLCPGVVG